MRTTLDIADDVLFAAKALARQEKKSLGQVVSELARRAFASPPESGQPGLASAPLQVEEELKAYGIAPPGPAHPGAEQLIRLVHRASLTKLACPRCGSEQTERLSAFGSTACKALYRCMSCREPFEHFKPI